MSCEYADVADVAYKAYPLDQIPADASWRDTATDNLVHLCTHVSGLAEADDYDLDFHFTDLLNCGDQLTRQESFAMHRRWAQQCLTILDRHAASAKLLGN